MVPDGVVRSTCQLCLTGCGVLVHMKDGKPVKIEGDPENPVNKGVLCAKGLASIEILNHPARLNHPLKRVGEKGAGKWQRITWDEALDTIATKMKEAKEKYGAESVAFMRGCAKGYPDGFMFRLANVFGTPNKASHASNCHVPRHTASDITYGFMSLPDYEYVPACIMIWGLNQANTAVGEHRRLAEAIDKGSKVIVIDPWKTGYVNKANIWLKPRPCSDLALALGMINIIINEGLYDKSFVDTWTVGFEQLKKHVQEYSPEKVSEITWVPADSIREAARLYATSKPACLTWGNGIDNNVNSFGTARALAILRSITGNAGMPGGDVDWAQSGLIRKDMPEIMRPESLPPEMRNKGLSASEKKLPFFSFILPQSIVKSILKGDPYKLRVCYVQGGSLLHTYSHALETYEAFKKLDFLVVTDFFMIPTAQVADIVLPCGTFLEIDNIHQNDFSTNVSIVQKVAQIGERRSDYEILKELGKRLGLEEYFWDTNEGVLDFALKPVGLTFKEFRKIGLLPGRKQYKHYLKDGFHTPSKKIEIFSKRLQEWGFDPLPTWREPPESPFSDPTLAKKYPLVMTNRKLEYYQHSGERQITSLRARRPEPLVCIHPDTAGKLGIVDNDWVYIETKRGKIKQKAQLVLDLDPRVVIVDYGWWFPERGDNMEVNGWAESNVNVLTDNTRQSSNPEMGSATLRGILCKVYKADN